MEYRFRDIEKFWQERWKTDNSYRVENNSGKPKYYVLDMFPYPSGAGLHVGHPLGYIASDIYARFKRTKGFNVLHPMGYDAFGLPAEQYAIEHGVHPAESTAKNIDTFRSQLDNIGFSYDWSREIRTSDPKYYKWTQWIFLQLFDSWYNRKSNKTERIETLLEIFREEGNTDHPIPNSQFQIPEYPDVTFTAEAWKSFSEKTKQAILMEYRVAYCGYGEVNWCEALGTVLANDEVVNGVSERGGYPVVKKKLRQWYLRITEYADRLLEGLQKVEFSEAMKDMQSNWIGKSSGAEVSFALRGPTPNPSPHGEGGSVVEERLTPDPSPPGEGSESSEDNYLTRKTGKYFQTANKEAWGTLKSYSKQNRKHPTKAENLLWGEIRNNKLGYKVRRQHAIETYIADFAILNLRLIIEVDGGYHSSSDQQRLDRARTELLKRLNYHVIRFSNDEVENDLDQVIARVKKEIERLESLKSSSPLLREEKGLGDEAGARNLEKGSGDEAVHEAEHAYQHSSDDDTTIKVYTTRPDTIFGVDFLVLAPEHELVESITTAEQQKQVEDYIAYVKSRSERERMMEKKISGVFTGGYAEHPLTGKDIPIWISEYVLAGYGTGAIMAVPSGDERDLKFANHFNIPVTNIFGERFDGEEAVAAKEARLSNSEFLDGKNYSESIDLIIETLEKENVGKRKVNFKIRDAAFSRQRYWGEPFPIKWENETAIPLPESQLPLELPYVETYKPGDEGEGPLANIPDWSEKKLETNTMPGYAGSSWYFLRYMDPGNEKSFCDRKASDYWGQVDLYVGGTEHAVGHLLYSRMWTKALYDLGHIGFDEPFRKLLNQGMIQGSSRFIYRVRGTHSYVSAGLKDQYETDELHVDVNLVDGVELDIDALKQWKSDFEAAEFILEDGKYICGSLVEKMSKRLYNTVNPDTIVGKYGADTFRMYEMFLGPVEMSKPWDTKGIEGVHRFLKKLWRLFFNEDGLIVTDGKPNDEEYRVLHKTIKKIEEDTERFSFNTSVSAFMVCVNSLTDLKCSKKEILQPLLILLAPYAPHISEELYRKINGEDTSVLDAQFPELDEKYLVETTKEYPVSVNGKLRTQINIDLEASQEAVQEIVLANPVVIKWMEGKPLKKLIYVKGKMVNVVV